MADSSSPEFVKTSGSGFILNQKPYKFIGTNLWYGMNLASAGPCGNRERLALELDILKSNGITNLRILAGSEGPDSAPWRIVPSLQTSPGVYNNDILDGLDFLLFEIGRRQMKAVLYFTNFWEWSGGMAQYLSWHGAGPIPYPQVRREWRSFQRYTSRFFTDRESVKCLYNFICFIINRVNKYTNITYRDDPAIMSWQLCNEPRGVTDEKAFNRWIDETSAFIKSIDANHLVSTGTEGETPYRHIGLDFIKNNSFRNIDYTTGHLWVQNWNIYNPGRHNKTFGRALSFAEAYIDKHVEKSGRLNKPFVLEEFGFPRDNGLFSIHAPTVYRDKFFHEIFKKISGKTACGKALCGINFWSWSGSGRPAEPEGTYWKPYSDLLGDPAHEPQGWYGVYDTDSTIAVIKEHCSIMQVSHQPAAL